MNNAHLHLVVPTESPADDDIFELDLDALPSLVEHLVTTYGPRSQNFDLSADGLAGEALEWLLEEASEAGVIRPPAGMTARAIDVVQLAGFEVFGLVMLSLGRAGMSISRWPIEIRNLAPCLAGEDACENLRDCLQEVLDEANLLVPMARALTPHLPDDEVDEEDEEAIWDD